jgi:hypothetical protein
VNGYLPGILAILSGVAVAVAGELISEEVRDRLDQTPRAILRLAARRLDPGQRVTVYRDEWEPELTYILKGTEARPVTRLIAGTWYALGILVNTRRIARHLHRPAPGQPDPAAAEAPEPWAGHVSLQAPRLASPGLIHIAGPLNLVASPTLSVRLTARPEHAPDEYLPDAQGLIDYLMSDLRLMGTGEGVPARLLDAGPRRGTGLLLYTTGYVLTAFVTKHGDAYTIAAVRPIDDRDSAHLARGALRLRPTTWSYYPELVSLPRRGDSRWSMISAEWGHLRPGGPAAPGDIRIGL